MFPGSFAAIQFASVYFLDLVFDLIPVFELLEEPLKVEISLDIEVRRHFGNANSNTILEFGNIIVRKRFQRDVGEVDLV